VSVAARPREHGYLVLADISGYTSFLTSTELEHAHGIVAELTALLIQRLAAPLRFVELEGDAVFAYAPSGAFADAERLLDMIEACYVAFRLRLEEMRRATTCTCSACALIGALDLKFIAHLGEFVLQQTPTGPKPIGPDVIVAHRLLKNRVVRQGTRAYAFLTDALLERAGGTLGLPAHTERYDDVGEVRGRIVDLGQAVARHREARIFVPRTVASGAASPSRWRRGSSAASSAPTTRCSPASSRRTPACGGPRRPDQPSFTPYFSSVSSRSSRPSPGASGTAM
jgi:Protein of unknown function (DUF2652)